jgi:Tfp pilus assembly protein FimV
LKGLLMRSLTGLALLVALSLSPAAVGNETPVHVLPATAAVKSVPVQPVAARRVTRSSKQTFFGKVMELERRKNAWLRRTFLGR